MNFNGQLLMKSLLMGHQDIWHRNLSEDPYYVLSECTKADRKSRFLKRISKGTDQRCSQRRMPLSDGSRFLLAGIEEDNC